MKIFLNKFDDENFLLQNDVIHEIIINERMTTKKRETRFFDDFNNKNDLIVTKKFKEKAVKIDEFEKKKYANFKKFISITVSL